MHGEEGDNTDLAAPEAFVLACMSVQCVDPSGRMNSVGSVISCVSRNKVGPGVLVNATSIDRSVSH